MNTNRIEFKECGNGIIKATVYGCKYDALDKINRKFIAPSTSDIEIGYMWKKDNEYLMRNSYSAIARCCADDTYDVEIGKQIATKKLSEKYNRAMDRRIARFAKHMKKSVDAMNKYMQTHKI